MSSLRRSRSMVFLACWSLLLAVVLLGPVLAPGYVLTYDMVWVPDLALRPDSWGVASVLPRAVPSDAVVAMLDELVPGTILQKVMLLVPLVAGGLGALRLLPRRIDGLLPRLAVVGLWQWNPYVVERLVLGQWPVLVGYGVLPWVLHAGRRWRRQGRVPIALWWLVPLGSLSPSAGIATAVALTAAAGGRGRRGLLLLMVAGANAPWVLAGLLHGGAATTDAAGGGVFALHGEGSLVAPLAALTLGGAWNTEVVPTSRAGVLGWVATLVLLGLAAAGARPWWRSSAARDRLTLLTCWIVGWGLAALTWALPGPSGWLDAHVPGAALLRDGGRLLLLCAPLLVALVGAGVAQVVRGFTAPAAAAGLGVACALLPVALLPDAAWGTGAHLRAVEYPDDYAAVRDAVLRAHAAGDVLLLPLSSYRAPVWNGGRKVLDPLSRYLPVDVLSSDSLQVGGVVVSGEDPRVQEAARALAGPTPASRARSLAAMGVGVVVVEEDAGASPLVAGAVLARTPTLSAVALRDVREVKAPGWWPPVMAVGWSAFLAMPLVGLVLMVRRRPRHRGVG